MGKNLQGDYENKVTKLDPTEVSPIHEQNGVHIKLTDNALHPFKETSSL